MCIKKVNRMNFDFMLTSEIQSEIQRLILFFLFSFWWKLLQELFKQSVTTLLMIQWPLLEKYTHINHCAMTDSCPDGHIMPLWMHRANPAYMTDEQPLIT